MRRAVLITGNPAYITGNPQADAFYQELEDLLKGEGFDVSRDPGEPKTMPADADVWLGHSRGADRFRWADAKQQRIPLGASLEGAINHPEDRAMEEGQIPEAAHFTLTPEMRAALLARLPKPVVKKAAVVPGGPPLTGPEAIRHALSKLDLDILEKKARDEIATRKITRRKPAVNMLNVIQGLRRNKVAPHELMLTKVPVLPPAFRPFSALGDTFIPGDVNELTADLFLVRGAHEDAVKNFGVQNTGDRYLDMRNAVRAVFGYGEPVRPKTKERGVSGLLQTITGSGPKHSFVQRTLLSKPVDSVGRGTITVDPELGLDEIGIPEDMAWTMYRDYVQRRLVRSGMAPLAAFQHLKDRAPHARKVLDLEIKERPVIYSRAPAWHKFNAVAGYPSIVKGSNIAVNPFITAGIAGDFDGDTINVHVPSLDDSVKEAKEKLLASKMLFSIKDQDKTVPQPKHESALGVFTANRRQNGKVHQFPDQAAAMQAIKLGQVDMEDEVEFPDGPVDTPPMPR